MSTYTLNVSLTPQQLEVMYSAGSNVIIAKPTEGAAPTVAWQAFRPMESNVVTWEEQYGIYASTVSLQNGARLTQMSQAGFPAVEGMGYTLTPTATFSPPAVGGEPTSYYATNEYPEKPILTFGLFQDATVNSQQVPGNAISAAPVPLGSTAQMTPFTTLFIWVQSEVRGNSVVTQTTSPKTKVVFGGSVTEISLGYESLKGIFVPKAGFELSEGASVDSYVPVVL